MSTFFSLVNVLMFLVCCRHFDGRFPFPIDRARLFFFSFQLRIIGRQQLCIDTWCDGIDAVWVCSHCWCYFFNCTFHCHRNVATTRSLLLSNELMSRYHVLQFTRSPFHRWLSPPTLTLAFSFWHIQTENQEKKKNWNVEMAENSKRRHLPLLSLAKRKRHITFYELRLIRKQPTAKDDVKKGQRKECLTAYQTSINRQKKRKNNRRLRK